MNEVMTIPAQTMSSLQIAELTGKQHKDVMKAIRAMESAWEKVRGRKFALTFRINELPNGGTRQDPYYKLTKTECLYIATKFNDEARAKLVLRWEELETTKPNIPQSLSSALYLAAQQAEQIEGQQKLLAAQSQTIIDLNEANAKMRVKVSYFDQILASKLTVTTTQIAQDYGMSAKKFNSILHDLRIQHKVGRQWILYAPHNTMGYVHSETFIPDSSTTGKVVMTTKWTQKGRLFLYDTLKKQGILPLIER